MHHFHYRDGRLFAEDVDVSSLADQHGTPLYVYSQSTLEDHWHKLDRALEPTDHLVCYAMKANSNLSVLRALAALGSGFDIVSAGELFRVIQAGGDPAKCTFAGVGKTRSEIEYALEKGIYSFNVESEAELDFINEVASAHGVIAPVALRVNPNVKADTHAKITTGTYENKFGIAFEEIEALYAGAAKMKHLRLRGVQTHIGSQITEVAPFVAAIEKLVPMVERLKQNHGIEFFDIGGGVGIVYNPALESGTAEWWNSSGKPLTPQEYCNALLPLVGGLGLRLIVEPGRFIVGNAGILVSEVLYVKQTGRKRFVIVDAAMNDLIRPAFYESYHEIVGLSQTAHGNVSSTDVVGPICESGDVFCHDRDLPLFERGDKVAFLSAGAYGFAMASNYNSRPRAAEILVKGATATVARQRESFEDLVRGEA